MKFSCCTRKCMKFQHFGLYSDTCCQPYLPSGVNTLGDMILDKVIVSPRWSLTHMTMRKAAKRWRWWAEGYCMAWYCHSSILVSLLAALQTSLHPPSSGPIQSECRILLACYKRPKLVAYMASNYAWIMHADSLGNCYWGIVPAALRYDCQC